jgi:PAS domain S-box-containing protein
MLRNGDGSMFQSGHVLVGEQGELVGVDRGFCAILDTEPASVIGRPVLEMTAPADRAECAGAIAHLRATGTPFRITKRFLRDDGTLIWVVNSVSILEGGHGPGLIMATIDRFVQPDEPRVPARLLSCAKFIADCKNDRATVLDPRLITDTAWDVIIVLYIAEAEGRAVTVAGLATALGEPSIRASRWIDVLLGQGIIEIETLTADAHSAKAFRLTAAAHKRLEAHLAKVNGLQDFKVRQSA